MSPQHSERIDAAEARRLGGTENGGGEQKRASIKARSHTSFARKYAEKERAGNGILDGPTGKEQEM